jgi:hypothetical protein
MKDILVLPQDLPSPFAITLLIFQRPNQLHVLMRFEAIFSNCQNKFPPFLCFSSNLRRHGDYSTGIGTADCVWARKNVKSGEIQHHACPHALMRHLREFHDIIHS